MLSSKSTLIMKDILTKSKCLVYQSLLSALSLFRKDESMTEYGSESYV